MYNVPGSIQAIYQVPTTVSYGTIRNYHQPGVRDICIKNLQTCKQNGQLYMGQHLRHTPTGDTLALQWPSPNNQDLKNFTDWVNDFCSLGFAHLTVSIGVNEDVQFTQEQADLECVFGFKVWEIMAASPLPQFALDIRAESSTLDTDPSPNVFWFLNECWDQYCKELGGPTPLPGRAGLLGYSIIVDSADYKSRINTIQNKIYLNSPKPDFWGIHVYEPAAVPLFQTEMANRGLRQNGYVASESEARKIDYGNMDAYWRLCWQVDSTLPQSPDPNFNCLALGNYS